MIVSGIWQIMVISKQHNYIKNKKYITWVKLLFFKTIFGLIAAYGLEFIAKFFVPELYRKSVLKYMRIGSFLFLFVYSGIIREFRETQLKKKSQENSMKQDENNEKKKTQ